MSEQAVDDKQPMTEPIVLDPSMPQDQEQNVALLEARIEQLQDTINGMRQMMLALLQVKR